MLRLIHEVLQVCFKLINNYLVQFYCLPGTTGYPSPILIRDYANCFTHSTYSWMPPGTMGELFQAGEVFKSQARNQEWPQKDMEMVWRYQRHWHVFCLHGYVLISLPAFFLNNLLALDPSIKLEYFKQKWDKTHYNVGMKSLKKAVHSAFFWIGTLSHLF